MRSITEPKADVVPPTYVAEWSLFADWCEATRNWCAPAAPEVVVAFLTACPARPATLSRRVAAVDRVHLALGHAAPGRHPIVVAALRAAHGLPEVVAIVPRFGAELVSAALNRIPVRGWPYGAVGRRDAALVTMVCSLELTRPTVVTLTLGDIATDPLGIRVGESVYPVEQTTEPGQCLACAVSRWQRVLVLYVRGSTPSVRRPLAAMARGEARAEERHDCLSPLSHVPTDLRNTPLFFPIDQYGSMGRSRLSIRSLTDIVGSRLDIGRLALDNPEWEGPAVDLESGDWIADRLGERPEEVDEVDDKQEGIEAPDSVEPALSREAAIERKRQAKEQMAEVGRLLDELDRMSEEAEQAISAVVDEAAEQVAHVGYLRGPTST